MTRELDEVPPRFVFCQLFSEQFYHPIFDALVTCQRNIDLSDPTYLNSGGYCLTDKISLQDSGQSSGKRVLTI